METIRLLIEQIVATHFPSFTFDKGRPQDINKYAPDVDFLCWLFPMNIPTGSNSRGRLNRTFNVTLAFLEIDKTSSNNDEVNTIVERQSDNCETFLVQLYLDGQNQAFEPGTGYAVDPVYKFAPKGIFSGAQITFQISAPDDLEIC